MAGLYPTLALNDPLAATPMRASDPRTHAKSQTHARHIHIDIHTLIARAFALSV